MNKIWQFLKKNYLFSIIGVAVLLIIIIALIVFAKRGTFGLDSDNNWLTLDCSLVEENMPNVGDDIQITAGMYKCEVGVHFDEDVYNGGKKILSANAHFALSEGLNYVTFSPVCPNENDECDVAEYSENGFAIGDMDGFENDSLIGTLFVSLDDHETDATYNVSLIDVELSDSDFEMLTLSNLSDSIVIGSGGEEPPENPVVDITFDNLDVDEIYNIIYNVPVRTPFSTLREKIDTDYDYVLFDSFGVQVDEEELDDFILQTGSVLSFVTGVDNDNNPTYISYQIAVLYDLTGDGVFMLNDITTLLRLYSSNNTNLLYRRAGDLNLTLSEIEISDVTTYLRRYNAFGE